MVIFKVGNKKQFKLKGMVFLMLVCGVCSAALHAQTDTRYDADRNLPFNEKEGDVNPQTGNLRLQYTDLTLPGRGGFDFSYGRIWSLNQANLYNMYCDPDNSSNRLSSDTIERVNRLGVGWSSTIPYILDDDKSDEFVRTLFFQGNAFQVDDTAYSFLNGPAGNETSSNLVGYDLLDLRIYRSAAVSYEDFPGGVPAGYGLADEASALSRYVLIMKDNTRYYFRGDGQLMMMQDKSGLNRIWYFYENPVPGERARLHLVVDSVGRHIRFLYNSAGCLEELSWDLTLGVKNGETRSLETEVRSIRFAYENLDGYPLAESVAELLYAEDRQDSYLLRSVYDQMGHETRFTYAEGGADFTFNASKPLFKNVFMLLTSISQYYQEASGEYEQMRCFEYDVPADGLYTKYFYNGYMESYRLSRQYYFDNSKRICKDVRYVYYEAGENGNSNQYATVVEMGGIKKRYLYLLSDIKSLQHALQAVITETDDGFLERREFLYDENRAKVQEDLYRNGKWVYRETFAYDRKGNLQRYQDKAGLVTFTKYDEKFSQPVSVVRSVTVGDARQEYWSESEINPVTGNVEALHTHYTGKAEPLSAVSATEQVSTRRYEYDVYGNIVREIDPAGNILHTVYDQATHSLPVKIWQDVEIASWSGGGDVHLNWQSPPSGQSMVRIRSWRVFNSDGSLWLEIDNAGYAREHYYNPRGDEIETVEPGSDDIRDFASPLTVNKDGQAGVDFDNFLSDYLGGTGSPVFSAYFAARENNPGQRVSIDFYSSCVRTAQDLDKAGGQVKEIEKREDGLGNVIAEVEFTGTGDEYLKTMVYDSLGRMVALTDPDRGAFLGKYTLHGTTFNRYEKTWLLEYDDLGRQKKILYPVTRKNILDIKRFFYNDVENSVEVVDPENRRRKDIYDWNGNVIETILPGDNQTASGAHQHYYYDYDELGRKVKFTDASGEVTVYKYDERDLLVEQDYGNGSDKMSYNKRGLLACKQDRKGQYQSFTYDQMGRNTAQSRYLSREDLLIGEACEKVNTVYDNRGNPVRVENGQLIEHYSYDYANRVIDLERRLKDPVLREAVVNAGWGGEANSQVFGFHYAYNDAGLVTQMCYPDGNNHYFNYDASLGRLLGISDGGEPFIDLVTYNKAGVVTRLEYANNTSQDWIFDNRKRINRLLISSGSRELVDLQYTLNGVGDVQSINDNEYTYDGFGRITAANTLIPGETDVKKLVAEHFGAYLGMNIAGIGAEQIEYNELADLNGDGRINGIDDIRASLLDDADIYDAESFRYDKSGNRTGLIRNGDEFLYTYGERNRLEKIEKKIEGESQAVLYTLYEYDANGNTVRRRVFEPDGVSVAAETVFSYDVLNRLVETVTSSGAGEKHTLYAYDNAGNRLVKQTDSGTTLYLRQGQVSVAMDLELPAAGAEWKGRFNRYVLSGDLLAGRITRTILNDDSTDIQKYWYHLDHLNSTKCITAANGEREVLYEYRAFGDQLRRLDGGNQDTGDLARYSYGGKELDEDTNLYYFNARYYDATIGRFVNVDPVQDGTNWYLYCNNNPLNCLDPTGLDYQKRVFKEEQVYTRADAIAGSVCRFLLGVPGMVHWAVAPVIDLVDSNSDFEYPSVPDVEKGDKRVTTTTVENLENGDILFTSQTTYHLYSSKQSIVEDASQSRLEYVGQEDGVNQYRITSGIMEDRVVSQEVVDCWIEDMGKEVENYTVPSQETPYSHYMKPSTANKSGDNDQ